MPPVVMTLMVARTDVCWLEPMLRHLSKTHRDAVSEIVVFVDTAPLGPDFQNRPGVGTLGELRSILEGLQKSDVIDRVQDLCYDSHLLNSMYKRHFGKNVQVAHDFRGYPISGIIYSIDSIDAEYVLHFDSDMLVHNPVSNSWIHDGIDLIRKRDDVMFVSPRSGPPSIDGTLKQRGAKYTIHNDFFGFKAFTSRSFLFSRSRLQTLLPIMPQYISWKRKAWQHLTGKSALWPWEVMVSRALESSKYIRADLKNSNAWTLHTPDHGPEFVKHLPRIIELVEQGWFPESQAGDYDLQLDQWIGR